MMAIEWIHQSCGRHRQAHARSRSRVTVPNCERPSRAVRGRGVGQLFWIITLRSCAPCAAAVVLLQACVSLSMYCTLYSSEDTTFSTDNPPRVACGVRCGPGGDTTASCDTRTYTIQ